VDENRGGRSQERGAGERGVVLAPNNRAIDRGEFNNQRVPGAQGDNQ